MSPASEHMEPSPAMVALDRFRLKEAMRGVDGWGLVQFDRETREVGQVLGLILECARAPADGSCDGGERIFGYIAAGEVTIEQFS